MELIYIILLGGSALTISVIGAIFSVTGLAKLFSGAPMAVMCMAAALEFAKVISAGFLQRYWKKSPILLRLYLTSAVVILICITSMGIYGYLSSAYQKSAISLKNLDIKIKSLTAEEKKIQDELNRIQDSIEMIPKNRVTKRIELQKELEPEIKLYKKRSFDIAVALQDANIQKLGHQAEIGPLIYVAEYMEEDQDYVAQGLIFLFVCIFDPLAIALVFATAHAIRLREENSFAKIKKDDHPSEVIIPDKNKSTKTTDDLIA